MPEFDHALIFYSYWNYYKNLFHHTASVAYCLFVHLFVWLLVIENGSILGCMANPSFNSLWTWIDSVRVYCWKIKVCCSWLLDLFTFVWCKEPSNSLILLLLLLPDIAKLRHVSMSYILVLLVFQFRSSTLVHSSSSVDILMHSILYMVINTLWRRIIYNSYCFCGYDIGSL